MTGADCDVIVEVKTPDGQIILRVTVWHLVMQYLFAHKDYEIAGRKIGFVPNFDPSECIYANGIRQIGPRKDDEDDEDLLESR